MDRCLWVVTVLVIVLPTTVPTILSHRRHLLPQRRPEIIPRCQCTPLLNTATARATLGRHRECMPAAVMPTSSRFLPATETAAAPTATTVVIIITATTITEMAVAAVETEMAIICSFQSRRAQTLTMERDNRAFADNCHAEYIHTTLTIGLRRPTISQNVPDISITCRCRSGGRMLHAGRSSKCWVSRHSHGNFVHDTNQFSLLSLPNILLVAVVIAFFVCYSPFHAQRVLATVMARNEIQDPQYASVFTVLTHISGITYYLSSTINPILYQVMSKKFQRALRETLPCCSKYRRNTSANDLDNTELNYSLVGAAHMGPASGGSVASTGQPGGHGVGSQHRLPARTSSSSTLGTQASFYRGSTGSHYHHHSHDRQLGGGSASVTTTPSASAGYANVQSIFPPAAGRD